MRQMFFSTLIVQVLLFSTSVAFSQTKQPVKGRTSSQNGKQVKLNNQSDNSGQSDLGLPPPVVDLIPSKDSLVNNPTNQSNEVTAPVLQKDTPIQSSQLVGDYTVKTIFRPLFCDEVKLPFNGESFGLKIDRLSDSTASISLERYINNAISSKHHITASIFRKNNRIEFIEKNPSYLHYCGYIDGNQIVLIETEHYNDPVARHTLNRYSAVKK